MIWTKNELVFFANLAKNKPNANLFDCLISLKEILNDLETSLYTPNFVIGYTAENSCGEIQEIFNNEGKQLLNLLQSRKNLYYKLKK